MLCCFYILSVSPLNLLCLRCAFRLCAISLFLFHFFCSSPPLSISRPRTHTDCVCVFIYIVYGTRCVSSWRARHYHTYAACESSRGSSVFSGNKTNNNNNSSTCDVSEERQNSSLYSLSTMGGRRARRFDYLACYFFLPVIHLSFVHCTSIPTAVCVCVDRTRPDRQADSQVRC